MRKCDYTENFVKEKLFKEDIVFLWTEVFGSGDNEVAQQWTNKQLKKRTEVEMD